MYIRNKVDFTMRLPGRIMNLLTVSLAVWLSADGSNLNIVPTTVKVFENDTVMLPCYVENSDPHARVRWWMDAELLGDTHTPHHLLPERYRMWHNRSLQISQLRPADSHNFTCEVMRTEPFSSIKQTHLVQVQYAPVIWTHPKEGYVDVQVGEYVDIGCNVTANPPHTLVWSKNGDVMALRDQRSRIKFKAESRSLAGVYECTARNGVGGPVRASIRVQILDAPVVSARQAWVHTTPGLRAVLEADLEFANPPAVTMWFKDGVQVHSDDRVHMMVRDHTHQLIVRNVRESDLGNYTFRAENRFGMADVGFRLSGVPNAANFKLDPSRTRATTTTFTLLWEVDSYSIIIEYNLWVRPYVAHSEGERVVTEDPSHNRWRRIVVPGSDDGEGPIHSMSYVVSGLTPGNVYEAFVTSRNRFGWSAPSTIVRFPTLAGVATPTPDTQAATHDTPEEIIEDTADHSLYTSNKYRDDVSSAYTVFVSLDSLVSLFVVGMLLW